MIDSVHIHQLSRQLGVPLAQLEKDYVMGWLLWGIAQNPSLADRLILKGGSCLRKAYFPETRFSDDLDFTTEEPIPTDLFREELTRLAQTVGRSSGVAFDVERTRVEQKETPDSELTALDGRVYFKGFAGDASLSFRIKFDVSPYEEIALPLCNRSLIHEYPDASACEAQVRCYSLEEILAEKLRSWIQRTRPRDLFDVVKIVHSGTIPLSKLNLLMAFFRKTIFKSIPLVAQEELLGEAKFQTIERDWLRTIICPAGTMLVVGNAISLFRDFIRALFHPDLLARLGVGVGRPPEFSFAVPTVTRETIIEAGKSRKLLRLRYKSLDRTVEPYSFRYKISKEGFGSERFFGFDRTRRNTIKNFVLHKIQAVSILPEEYVPRWVVEF